VKDDPQKHTKEIYQGMGSQWFLTTQEKKRILLNNIYGVDIDNQAVEVTKLSLLLKVLEGENEETLNRQLKMWRERALPDLGNNIKCGNSLIGPDFYDNRQMSLLDEEERYRINVFDWNAEFPAITKVDGFDVVIGNPPYVRMEVFKEIKQYLRDHYESHDERTDLYVYFIEKSLRLLKRGGLYGVIVSNKWVRSKYGERLRGVVIGNVTIKKMIDFGELPVFQGAATFPVIFIARRGSPEEDYSFSFTPPFDKELFQRVTSCAVALADAEKTKASLIPSKNLSRSAWRFGAAHIETLLVKVTAAGEPLAKYTKGRIRYGIKSGLVEAFVIDKETRQRLVEQSSDAVRLIKPYVLGDDVRNYHIRHEDRFLIYTYHGVDMRGSTSVLRHLEQFKTRLQNRATKQEWYELQQPQQRYVPDYESPKIIYPDIAKESRFALDTSGLYPADTTFIIPLPDRYLLGVLNSRVVFFYLGMVCPVLGDARQGGRLRLKLNYIRELPIPRIDLSRPDDNARYNKVVTLVEHMLELHKELAAAKTPDAKTRLQRQIDATNHLIDQLVYELYGLTEEEIKVVEEATRK